MIKRKLKTCKGCGNQRYLFGKGLCSYCYKPSTMAKNRVRNYADPLKGNKKAKDLDKWFSHYIRLRYADTNGKVKCYTCNTSLHWTGIQCGHYEGRAHMGTRWLDSNCRPQCRHCNEELRGNPVQFKIRLEMESPGITEMLRIKASTRTNYSDRDLGEMLHGFKFLVRKLKEEKGIA